jgi:hypothetical protein
LKHFVIGTFPFRETFLRDINKDGSFSMRTKIIALSAAAALFTLPQIAWADGDGAVKGGVGGAVAGALVGGPVGAAVGGAAGMAVGGAASGPDHPVVVVQPDAQPAPGTVIERRAADVPPGASDTRTVTHDENGCVTSSMKKTNGMGDSVTHSKTNC